MTHKNDNHQKPKVSPEFAARLVHLGPQQKVRALVVLRTENGGRAPSRRQSHVERQAAIEATRKSVEAALTEIDEILERCDGKRLATTVDALGSIPVETTAAGITALAASERVKVIFEDQPISLLPRPKQS